ncbi:retrovirus-related Pol polyprotein from transposon 17.6 [Trichonephila clavipes]|nr:retrovirus-related Pol polyprotein from transposon 17.6 [Trichonephila clavipes]
MDDLVIPAKDEKEGLEKLREVLEVASKYGLEMKFKKCQFLRKVEFLGHVVENGTIRPSIAKTIAVKKFPVPTTVKQVQSFLGLTGYFRKFIPAYSQIAKPLSDLTRKDNPFMFEQPQMEAFEKLKKLLTESPVLSIFQQGRTTELHTDASQQGYGAVLLQEAEDGKLHPVQYMSQKKTPAEEKYSSYELDFSKDYGQKDLVTRVARWTLLLEEYDYDCTSFRPENATCRHSEQVPSHHNYKRYSHRKTTKSPTGRRKYSKFKVTNREQTNKKVWEKGGISKSIPKEDVPLSTYHVDFIGPLPSTNKRYQHILTIIDAFTKFTWLYPVNSTTLEDALDKLKLQQDFRQSQKNNNRQGFSFNSKGFDDYCTEEKNPKICRSPPAYPEGTVKWRESTEL